MPDVQLASFVNSEEEVFASLLALKSLSILELGVNKPIMLMSRPMFEDFESKYPDLKLKPIYNKLGAKLEIAFSNGYNTNLGLRPAMSKVMKLGKGGGLLYFSPRMVFLDGAILDHVGDEPWAARQPDSFWPEIELYGPNMTQIWSRVVSLGGGELGDWIDEDMPDEYWRRYPAASPTLFYAPDPSAFEQCYGEINDALAADLPKELEGQGHIPPEACLTATIVKLNGKIIEPLWDFSLQYYQDFYDLILRMNDHNWERFTHKVLETAPVRPVLKSVEEYKLIFYQNRVIRVRENLDDIESNFSILRMQELISKRKIRRNVKKRIKENSNLPIV